jgi:trimethylamine--corrinoid protein Co-methyltransferase
MERISAAGVRILAEQGLRILHDEARDAAARAGLRVDGDRAFPDSAAIEECVEAARAEGGGAADAQTDGSALRLIASQYPTHIHDLDTDTVVPLTTARLIEAAKLVDSLLEERVGGYAPGCPADVPAHLQPVLQYKIQAQCCRCGATPVDPKWAESLPYVMDMAEVLGQPMRSLPVYVVSPLTIGAESLKCVMAVRDRLDHLHTGNMSSVGGTAPVRIGSALALGLAEVVGSAMVLRAITGLPVSWSVAAMAFDLRAMAMSFGGPEDVLFRWACEEFGAFCHGRDPGRPQGMARTQAKLPGPQASAEKMAGLLSGALVGSRDFGGAGTLSLDEVFSPEQLIVDCELRDYVERLVAGIDGDCDPAAAFAEAASGLDGGFLRLDSTLDHYREVYWLPRLFERRSLAGWLGDGAVDMRDRAKAIARERIRKHDYQLAPDLAREVDAVYARAERDLVASGG